MTHTQYYPAAPSQFAVKLGRGRITGETRTFGLFRCYFAAHPRTPAKEDSARRIGINYGCSRDFGGGFTFDRLQKVRVIKRGRSQPVLIPREFWFQANHVYIQQEPNTGNLIFSEKPTGPDNASNPNWDRIFRLIDEADFSGFEPRPASPPPKERD